jgi:hypothetical protein
MVPQTNSPFEELFQDVYQTCGMRFEADRRLRFHDKVSNIVVSFFAASLILFTLFRVLHVAKCNEQVLSIAEIFLPVFIIVFSLLVARNDYALRADRMHRSALELNDLKRRLRLYRQSSVPMSGVYDDFAKEYSNILSHTDNHDQLDKHRFEFKHWKDRGVSWWKMLREGCVLFLLYLFNFLHYIVALGLVLAAIWFLLIRPLVYLP